MRIEGSVGSLLVDQVLYHDTNKYSPRFDIHFFFWLILCESFSLHTELLDCKMAMKFD